MMRRWISLLVMTAVMLSLCACQGNFGSIDPGKPVAIPENGIISQSIAGQIKNENAIGVFIGSCGEFSYRWVIFGSDIAAPRDMDLGVRLSKTAEGGIKAELSRSEGLGFPAMLCIDLNEKWEAWEATAYGKNGAEVPVSLTGTKTTILNLNLNGTVGEVLICPDMSLAEEEPQPVEPEDQEVDEEKTYTCTFSIECSTILNDLSRLDPEKLEMVPSGGVILAQTTVTFYEGESVFDVLQRICREKGIHMESSWTPIYNSAYIEGIHNLYEFDCGSLSGWMYRVNGWYPNYGCSRYQLKDGDVVQWRYTCDLGNDVGGKNLFG